MVSGFLGWLLYKAWLMCRESTNFSHIDLLANIFIKTEGLCGGDGSVFCFVYLFSKFYSKVEPN